MGRLSSRMGTAIHDSVERTWLDPTKVKQVMEVLGYPKRLINALVVNPDPTTVTEDQFAVYLEQRAEKQVGSLTVSGKFDAVFDGVVEDIKTTKTYGYIKGNKVQDYILQGSMYKWLNPNIITGDVIRINYMFTDWLGASSYQQGYPAAAQISEEYELMTIPQTEQWVRNRINQIQNLWINQNQICLIARMKSYGVMRQLGNTTKKVKLTKADLLRILITRLMLIIITHLKVMLEKLLKYLVKLEPVNGALHFLFVLRKTNTLLMVH